MMMMMTVPMAIMMLAGWVFHMQMSPPVNAVPGPTYKVAPILQDHNQTTSDRWPQPYNQSSVFTQPWPNLLGRFGPFCATNKKKCRNCVWNVCCPGKGQFCWLLHPHLKHMPWKFPLFLQFVVCFPLHFLPCYLFPPFPPSYPIALSLSSALLEYPLSLSSIPTYLTLLWMYIVDIPVAKAITLECQRELIKINLESLNAVLGNPPYKWTDWVCSQMSSSFDDFDCHCYSQYLCII